MSDLESIELLAEDICRELVLIQRICGAPGYRPHYTSTLLACAPHWAFPALLRAREVIRNEAEDKYDLCMDLHFETTALACWFPGAELGAHADNCKEYLSHREVSAAVWLNDDFEGGAFFYQDGPEVNMRKGRGAIYPAAVLHGVHRVEKGERFSFLVWMTKSEDQAEDAKILSQTCDAHVVSSTERLFGRGPQAQWPEESHVSKETVVAFSGQSLAELEEKYTNQIDEFQVWFPVDRWRAAVALLAFDDYCGASSDSTHLVHRLVDFIREREQLVALSRRTWSWQGFLSVSDDQVLPPGKAYADSRVPGLQIMQDVVEPSRQSKLVELLIEMVGDCDQAMRFGDLPQWALDLAEEIGISANQMIVNMYMPGKGIIRHIDLLRFDERVCGLSLGAPATMVFRQLSANTEVRGGDECRFVDNDFSGRIEEVPLRPGDAYVLEAEARYRWTHEIPGKSIEGRRFSITFRSVLAESPVNREEL